ncbi:DUF2975 domain-containing protein [Flavobacterium sp.]|uniref:DUF2975 domain-containing protein n=1 Tax=Flavobacterium sp. TaxID=239 RepID=UPI002FD894AE
MTKRNNLIWKAIQTVCWFIFAGYCVQSGGLLFNFIYSLFRPIATHDLYLGLDLSELFIENKPIYIVVLSIIIILSALKAYVFFEVLKFFKSVNIENPFSNNVQFIISTITYQTFYIGIISLLSKKVVERLISRGYTFGSIEDYWHDGIAYLFFSSILFVISLMFKRGIELQNENNLTI